jgi:uncharacterized protein (TIGR02300 family)
MAAERSAPIMDESALQGRTNMASARSSIKAKLRGMTLANTDLGEKRICPECGAKFYDLGKRPVSCPKCKATFDPVTDAVKPKRVREKPRPEPEDEDEEVEDEDLDEAVGEDEDLAADEEDVDLVDDDEVVDPEEETDVEPRPAAGKKYVDPDVADEDEIADDEDDLTIIDEDEDFDGEDIELEDDADDEEL